MCHMRLPFVTGIVNYGCLSAPWPRQLAARLVALSFLVRERSLSLGKEYLVFGWPVSIIGAGVWWIDGNLQPARRGFQKKIDAWALTCAHKSSKM